MPINALKSGYCQIGRFHSSLVAMAEAGSPGGVPPAAASARPPALARVGENPGGGCGGNISPHVLGLLLPPDRLLFGWCDEVYGKIAYGSQCNPVNLPQPLFEPSLVYANDRCRSELARLGAVLWI